MRSFSRCLLGEFKKRRRTVFPYLHLGIPFVLPAALIMFLLSRNASISPEAAYRVLFETIGVGTPVIISVLCGMVADAEHEAGHFQNMLRLTESKMTSYLSQTTMMILSYSASLFLTIFTYTSALDVLALVDGADFTTYYLTGMIFTITSVFHYVFYQFIAYNAGMGICSLFGFGGLIVAALSMTTIADQAWPFLPWAWANRVSTYAVEYMKPMEMNGESYPMLVTAGYSFLIFTTAIIGLSIVWVNRWIGRKTHD